MKNKPSFLPVFIMNCSYSLKIGYWESSEIVYEARGLAQYQCVEMIEDHWHPQRYFTLGIAGKTVVWFMAIEETETLAEGRTKTIENAFAKLDTKIPAEMLVFLQLTRLCLPLEELQLLVQVAQSQKLSQIQALLEDDA